MSMGTNKLLKRNLVAFQDALSFMFLYDHILA
jgi:hypothetical protein